MPAVCIESYNKKYTFYNKKEPLATIDDSNCHNVNIKEKKRTTANKKKAKTNTSNKSICT